MPTQKSTHLCIMTYQSFLRFLLGLRGGLHGCVKPELGLSVLLWRLHICEEEDVIRDRKTNVDMWLKFIWEFKKKTDYFESSYFFPSFACFSKCPFTLCGKSSFKIGLIFRIMPTHFFTSEKNLVVMAI